MKYEIWSAIDDGEFEPHSPIHFFDTYQEAYDLAEDWYDFQCQCWSNGVDVGDDGYTPNEIVHYQIRDENGKEIYDAYT
jgi:hypothetical protein